MKRRGGEARSPAHEFRVAACVIADTAAVHGGQARRGVLARAEPVSGTRPDAAALHLEGGGPTEVALTRQGPALSTDP